MEVFFEDRKLHEGWGREAKQFDEDGSSRALILSLSIDHCHRLHPEQNACIENKLPVKGGIEFLVSKPKKLIEQYRPEYKLDRVWQV